MRKVIGLDLDDVLMDFRFHLDQYHNSYHGTSFKREDAKEHDLWIPYNCTKKESGQRVVDFYRSPEHQASAPVPGAPEAIRELSKHHTLVVITSRPDFIKERTLLWLDKHFGDSFDEIVFTNLFGGSGPVKTKAEACKELGVNIFVDDYLGYAHNVAESGTPVLLYNAPWNQGELHPNITRVKSWNHILEVLSSPEMSHLAKSNGYNK